MEQRPLEGAIIRKYIGGMGVNLKLMYDNFSPGADEFSLNNTENLLNDYYDERGWSISRGIPTAHTLKRMGLENEGRALGL